MGYLYVICPTCQDKLIWEDDTNGAILGRLEEVFAVPCRTCQDEVILHKNDVKPIQELTVEVFRARGA